jgi:hypothetical protein
MKPSSAKNKGRLLQNWVVTWILHTFPDLEPDDVRSTSMGAGGEDIKLSPAARKLFPYSVECKSRARFALYNDYDQALSNCPDGAEPILVVKANRRKPVVIIDAEYFFGNLM